MVTSFEIEAYYKACEVSDIDLHIEFLRGKLDEFNKIETIRQRLSYDGLSLPEDSDNNLMKITMKISKLKARKAKLKSKIKQLRA
jgi:hypothetical protein